MDSHALLQGIFPIHGLKPHLLGLLHWQVGSLPLAPPGKPCGTVVEIHNYNKHLEVQYNKINKVAAAAAKSRQSCPTLCDTTDGSPPGSSVPGILQARILEWVVISFSKSTKHYVETHMHTSNDSEVWTFILIRFIAP